MNVRELPAFLEDELEYPLDHASAVDQIGSVEIEAPNDREAETVSTIVDPVGQETYRSADELFETIIGNVSEVYIGRKFYDDRGGNPLETAAGLEDEVNISF